MKTFKQLIIENTNTVGPNEIMNHIRKLHHSPQDFDEGDIEDRVYKHDSYELKSVSLKKIKIGQWATDSNMVDKYKKDLEKTKSPPIVLKPNGTIIDGSHRAEAHAASGKTHIDAYVGVPKKRK